ncbi:MAG: ankyrin repeat domain-containing protein [Rickettsia sp.]|nr:ankyrin repeat domain-containing protein [Rickettsia sp.]
MLITKNFIVKLKKIIDLIKKYSQKSFIRFLLRCLKWIFILIIIFFVILGILILDFFFSIGFIFKFFSDYCWEWIYLIKDWNFFLWMIALGQFWITKLMIATGADVNFLSKESEQTPLMIAARFNNSPQITKLLIKKGADPTFVSTKLSAIDSDDLGVIQEIINKDQASFFVAKQLGSNALMSASAGGSVKIAKIILDLIPKDEVKDYINLKSKDGNGTLLHNLNRNPSLEVVKLLVENGANINYANMLQFRVPSPLRLAATKNEKIFQYLISNGGNVNFIQSNGHSLLQASVYYGQTQLVKLLINSGADLNYQDKCGKTALISAVERNDLKLAKILVEAGADLNINSECEGTALYYAVNSYYRGIFAAYTTEMIKLLIDSGADLNISHKGQLAFITAACDCHVGILKMFLEAGVDINQTNNLKETALIAAARKYTDANAKFLIDNGIDIHKEDKFGHTVLEEAVTFQRT